MQNLLQKLSQKIEKLEGVKAKKSSTKISYAHRSPFATIHIKKETLELEFITPSKINHAKLKKIKQLKPNKFKHSLTIASKEDINPQVTGWLMIAHATN